MKHISRREFSALLASGALAGRFGVSASPKGWIKLGHLVSEEPGILELADWIRGFVPEVPVRFVEAREPFWVPNAPINFP